MNTISNSKPRLLAAILGFAALAVFPLLKLDFYNELLARVAIFAIFAVSRLFS